MVVVVIAKEPVGEKKIITNIRSHNILVYLATSKRWTATCIKKLTPIILSFWKSTVFLEYSFLFALYLMQNRNKKVRANAYKLTSDAQNACLSFQISLDTTPLYHMQILLRKKELKQHSFLFLFCSKHACGCHGVHIHKKSSVVVSKYKFRNILQP